LIENETLSGTAYSFDFKVHAKSTHEGMANTYQLAGFVDIWYFDNVGTKRTVASNLAISASATTHLQGNLSYQPTTIGYNGSNVVQFYGKLRSVTGWSGSNDIHLP
jgi:hypothetical protein